MESSLFKKCVKHIKKKKLRETLIDLVDIPSPTSGEKALAQYLVDRMGNVGARTYLQEVSLDRPNAIGTISGNGTGSNLMFTGHMDTSYDGNEDYLVGKGFKPKGVYKGGWIWGLGANNMKGGLASALVAFEAIQKERIPLKGDLIFAGVVGEIEKAAIEEFRGEEMAGYGTGSRHLVLHGATADFAILAEPTGLRIANANLGVVWAKITTFGTVSHSAMAHRKGIKNAIRSLHKVQTAIEKWIPKFTNSGEFMGEKPSVNISSIRGGWPWRLSRNPVEASLYLDIRILPGQEIENLRREIRKVLTDLSKKTGEDEAILDFYVTDPATYVAEEEEIVTSLARAHKEIIKSPPDFIARRPGADATHFNHYGIPCICYGPGFRVHPEVQKKGQYMHDAGEHIHEDDLETASRVFLNLALKICN
ncbi:MAG: M20/M25/M40 family metallo-hydrolase [Nitrospinota bacterium]|nr:M20/M25/M40 family metallo-hydrolase [Nitrospinota bacterium]